MKPSSLLSLICMVCLMGCASASSHRQDVQSDEGERLTVGTVQKEIRIGMAASQVVEALGSPNIVTTDENRQEVWVYDKFATDVTYSASGGGAWLVLGSVGGASGSASSSQRTLTVVVKFDQDKKVRDFAYHSSRF
ncbi:MAG TPA: hypothetical protein PKM88_09365 [bacterium]|nr:hypothetical protein [bacterium]